jgi:hypothetical protein
MTVAPSDRLVVSDAVVTRAVKSDTVLLNTATGRYFTLDEIGSRAWTLLTTLPSVQAAREALLVEYAVEPDQLARDLEALIEILVARGLVEVRRG